MSTKTVSKVTLTQQIRGLIAGTQKHLPSGPVTLDATATTQQDLVQTLQGVVDVLGASDTAKASWKESLKNVKDTKAKKLPLVSSYRSWIVATFGSNPSALADFGMTPRKVPAPLTAEQKAAAAAKRNATRAARHTMGKNQKKNIKGTVASATPPVDVAKPPVTATTSSPPAVAPATKLAS